PDLAPADEIDTLVDPRAAGAGSVILALDPGVCTGWAWSDGSSGTLDLSHNDDLAMLYGEYHGWIADTLWARKPRLLVIERASGRAAFWDDRPVVLTGMAHMVARLYGVARGEVTASQVKEAVAGRGRASKGD